MGVTIEWKRHKFLFFCSFSEGLEPATPAYEAVTQSIPPSRWWVLAPLRRSISFVHNPPLSLFKFGSWFVLDNCLHMFGISLVSLSHNITLGADQDIRRLSNFIHPFAYTWTIHSTRNNTLKNEFENALTSIILIYTFYWGNARSKLRQHNHISLLELLA